MKGALVLLSSLLSIAASQGPMGMNRIPFHHHAIAAVEKARFGTFGQPMKFDCNVLSCSWADNVVHEDWMFYGAGWGNPEAMDPTICAKRCALDINCAAFEYVVDEHKNTNYCSWWRVGSCGFDKGSFIGNLTRLDPEIAETCSKVPVQVVWCEDNKVDPTTIIKDEYVRVSPWPVDISDEGVFNVAHTLSIGGNFLQGIRAGTEVHLTVVDNDGNEVDCTDLGELLGLELDEEIFIGSCSYDLPATAIAGVNHVDLLSIPAGTELGLDLVDDFNDYFQEYVMELNHAHMSLTINGTEILCGDFRLNN